MIGRVVGNYKIEELLGEGGMGAVYRGVDMMLEREVAIKMLRPELASQPALVERFRSEAVTLAKLYHPNIATLHSFFRQADGLFMVMEYVRGETLDKVLARAGAMRWEEAAAVFCRALEGIHYAHQFGVVHRDIKPGNIMLTPEGAVKVMDFGIARVLGASRLTRTGFLVGTLEYMSPEQVLGEETDARSDIYSLGALLYEMLTGRVPFTSTSEYKLMKSHAEEAPRPPRDLASGLPEQVERAVLRALSKRKEDRFASADEFRTTLLAALDRGTAVAAAPLPAPPVTLPPATRLAATAAAGGGPAFFRGLNHKHYAGLTILALALAATPFALSGLRGAEQPAAAARTAAAPTPAPEEAATPPSEPKSDGAGEQVRAEDSALTPPAGPAAGQPGGGKEGRGGTTSNAGGRKPATVQRERVEPPLFKSKDEYWQRHREDLKARGLPTGGRFLKPDCAWFVPSQRAKLKDAGACYDGPGRTRRPDF